MWPATTSHPKVRHKYSSRMPCSAVCCWGKQSRPVCWSRSLTRPSWSIAVTAIWDSPAERGRRRFALLPASPLAVRPPNSSVFGI
jgi:hypothetical protein